jgi:hypothetical protein
MATYLPAKNDAAVGRANVNNHAAISSGSVEMKRLLHVGTSAISFKYVIARLSRNGTTPVEFQSLKNVSERREAPPFLTTSGVASNLQPSSAQNNVFPPITRHEIPRRQLR